MHERRWRPRFGQVAAARRVARTRRADRLHYLNKSDDTANDATRFWFDTRANLRQEIEDRKRRFDDGDVVEKIHEVLCERERDHEANRFRHWLGACAPAPRRPDLPGGLGHDDADSSARRSRERPSIPRHGCDRRIDGENPAPRHRRRDHRPRMAADGMFPTPRQITMKCEPCPCGSGRKFKRCCMPST